MHLCARHHALFNCLSDLYFKAQRGVTLEERQIADCQELAAAAEEEAIRADSAESHYVGKVMQVLEQLGPVEALKGLLYFGDTKEDFIAEVALYDADEEVSDVG